MKEDVLGRGALNTWRISLQRPGKIRPGGVAGISTGQLTMEEFAIFGHVMRNYLKTNVDGNTRLCMATAVVAHKQSYGFDAPGYTLKDLELSDTMVFVRSQPGGGPPHSLAAGEAEPGPQQKVIVIDPRESETAMNADYWYPVRWKGDSACSTPWQTCSSKRAG